MTTEGKQCLFPFKFKNESGEQTFTECASIGVYKPWCPTKFVDNDADAGVIEEWGECLPDCPHQEVEIVCQDPPTFPKLKNDDNPKSANYTVVGMVPDRSTGDITPGVNVA